MPYGTVYCTRDYDYNMSKSNIGYGILQNGFVIINLDYPNDELELDIIDTLLKKHKKLWLCGEWRTYNIPEYITHLCFDPSSELFDNEIMNKLPASLEFLSIMTELFNEPLTNLPPNLKHLEIHSNCECDAPLDFLPIGIETLILTNLYDSNVIINATFPPKLKTLVLETKKINSTLRNLPATLEYLYIHADKCYQEGIKEYLPNVNIIYH